MRIFAAVFCLFCIAAQGWTTYLWQIPDALNDFEFMFHHIYKNGAPAWSEWAFHFGSNWYFVTAMMLVCWLLAVLPVKTPYLLRLTTLCALLSLASMWYALYPLHIMFTDGYSI
ncbi:hypothetical protein CHH28_03690 [Bacterioplanes sanyensis]|uniref:Uncharacterized protein n=1 Tax=Bacterioplanes sanyensis TaxID=1249553 RepID=A0A222FGE0_9GAMM|nr:hypothetical protein [Bacterioplanes sanyensis]ASP37830.1 hypothetical protein CHH28_03690 [Bacterioplanes sanyensis]